MGDQLTLCAANRLRELLDNERFLAKVEAENSMLKAENALLRDAVEKAEAAIAAARVVRDRLRPTKIELFCRSAVDGKKIMVTAGSPDVVALDEALAVYDAEGGR